MKSASLIIFALLAVGLSAREWQDIEGRKFKGVLVDVVGEKVGFIRYYDSEVVVAKLENISEPDRRYIAQWEAHRDSAVVLTVKVFQALTRGALVSAGEIKRLPKIPSQYRRFSPIRQSHTVESQKGWMPIGIETGHVYIDGLDDVLDNGKIRYLVAWPIGFHEYTTTGGAFKRVAKYSLHPPGHR